MRNPSTIIGDRMLTEILDDHRKWLLGEGGVKANLSGANLSGANLRGADLRGATMADGRKWEDYRADHLAGLCQTPEIRERAIAAWGEHTWEDCPMHNAHGWASVEDAPEALRKLVACWVAAYDAGLLNKPEAA